MEVRATRRGEGCLAGQYSGGLQTCTAVPGPRELVRGVPVLSSRAARRGQAIETEGTERVVELCRSVAELTYRASVLSFPRLRRRNGAKKGKRHRRVAEEMQICDAA
jgi:hypothetical protein